MFNNEKKFHEQNIKNKQTAQSKGAKENNEKDNDHNSLQRCLAPRLYRRQQSGGMGSIPLDPIPGIPAGV